MSMTDLHADEIFGPTVAANLAADPLADRFEVEAYANGECDVFGNGVHVAYHKDPECVRVWIGGGIEHRVTLSRAAFHELILAGDVLIRATQKNTGE